jgi:hypothetical protein
MQVLHHDRLMMVKAAKEKAAKGARHVSQSKRKRKELE